jgi:hypothetical protein
MSEEHQNAHKRRAECLQLVENVSTSQVTDLANQRAPDAPPQKTEGREKPFVEVEYIRQMTRTCTMRPRRIRSLRKFVERRVYLVMAQTAEKDGRKRQCYCRNSSDETRTVNRQSKEINPEVTLTLSRILAVMPTEGERFAATTTLVVPNADAEVKNLWKGRQQSVVAMNTLFRDEMVNLPPRYKKDILSLKGGEGGQPPAYTPQRKIANACSMEQAVGMMAILPLSPEKRPQR